VVGITGTSPEDQYTFMVISRLVLIMRGVSDESCRENQNTHLMFNNFFLFFKNHAVYEITWKNIVQPERSQMKIWRMRMASWIPGATDTCTLRCLHQECYCEVQCGCCV